MTGFLLPDAPVASVDAYLAAGGGTGIRRAVELGPQATIDEVTRSGLRGRGGGGFPTGRKWAGVAGDRSGLRYLVCNGAEGEPGTFKDRAILRANPYQVVEGVIIAAFAIGATEAFIATKARFEREIEALSRAVTELQDAGICGDCRITVVPGPDEYLFGEEKAMLEVIEGNAPLPRLLPPYQHGLFASAPHTGWTSGDAVRGPVDAAASNPTLVNNVETLANVPHILTRGADWFRSMGTATSPGTVVCTVVGDVVHPGVAEVELGTPLRDVIDAIGGGVADGRRVKAVLSGVANPVVTTSALGTPLDHEAFAAAGTGLGSCGFVVFDDTACMVETARLFSRFLAVESCGQCPPCKLGSAEITARLERIEAGAGTDADLGELHAWLVKVTDGNRCFLAVEEQQMVSSLLRAFPEEFAEHLERGACPRPRAVELPKLVDLAGGVATYDERQYRKRSDWTYADEDVSAAPGVGEGYDATGAALGDGA